MFWEKVKSVWPQCQVPLLTCILNCYVWHCDSDPDLTRLDSTCIAPWERTKGFWSFWSKLGDVKQPSETFPSAAAASGWVRQNAWMQTYSSLLWTLLTVEISCCVVHSHFILSDVVIDRHHSCELSCGFSLQRRVSLLHNSVISVFCI